MPGGGPAAIRHLDMPWAARPERDLTDDDHLRPEERPEPFGGDSRPGGRVVANVAGVVDQSMSAGEVGEADAARFPHEDNASGGSTVESRPYTP